VIRPCDRHATKGRRRRAARKMRRRLASINEAVALAHAVTAGARLARAIDEAQAAICRALAPSALDCAPPQPPSPAVASHHEAARLCLAAGEAAAR